jgi:hypothetical protein
MLTPLTYCYKLYYKETEKQAGRKHFEPILREIVLVRWQRSPRDAMAFIYDWVRIFQDKMGRVENPNPDVEDQFGNTSGKNVFITLGNCDDNFHTSPFDNL